jgi:hypothetical protein
MKDRGLRVLAGSEGRYSPFRRAQAASSLRRRAQLKDRGLRATASLRSGPGNPPATLSCPGIGCAVCPPGRHGPVPLPPRYGQLREGGADNPN